MHRRTVLELSRRHGVVDLTCAARHRAPVFSPVPTYVPRRTFRSSLATFNSSQPPSDGNGDGDGTAGRPFPTPRFAPRWGASQASKPAGLSPAERAMRETLVTKHTQDQKAHEEQRNPIRRGGKRPGGFDTNRGDTRERNPRGDQHHHKPRDDQHHYKPRSDQHHHKPRGDQHNPVRHGPRRSGQLDPSRDGKKSNWLPPHLRFDDWTCPSCQYNCFGKHLTCPSCQTPRPMKPPRPGQGQDSQQSFKVRNIGREGSPEWEDRGAPRPRTGRPRRDKAEEFTGVRLVQTSENAEQPVEIDASDKPPRERRERRKPEKTASKKEDWTWDRSALERMETPEENTSQTFKGVKRRDGRRQRANEVKDQDDDFDDDLRKRREDRQRSKKEKARKRERQKEQNSGPSPLYLPEFISVSNLADVIGVRPAQFVQRMNEMGFEDVTYSHILDAETAGLVATEFNFEPIFETGEDDLVAAPEPEDKSVLPPRPPVVTIMGHVDHGKTTILDWLRKSSVVASEHGGITQHIGAFSVAMPSGKTITFLDTPGHSAFLEMRRRGADVTDIVVLVVAADDSVKPQTIEAIKHATQAKVPIIVAVSKMDKEGVNPDKVKQDLSIHGVHVEDYGGDVQAIGVSGKTGEGMLDLEEAIVALSEMLDHRAEVDANAEGWVIEASTKSYGRVASVLIKRGTLRTGDVIVAGTTWARVRTLRNEAGVAIDEATPGMPVEVDGWREQPIAGTELLQASTEQQAKEVVDYRQDKSDTQKLGEDATAINEARRELLEKRRQDESEGEKPTEPETSGPKPVHFIIKGDVGGSAEAVLNSVTAIGNNEVYANVLRSEVGPISEFDIEHAASAKGNVISFNMPIDPAMWRMAEARGVKIMDYNIIYKLMDEVKAALSEHLTPNVSHRVTGEAEIGQVFDITTKGREKTSIAGCKVRNGIINKARKVRVLRGDETIYDGSINSLKNVKKDVTEMRKDTECGIAFEGWTNFAVGDHIQCYEEISEKRYL